MLLLVHDSSFVLLLEFILFSSLSLSAFSLLLAGYTARNIPSCRIAVVCSNCTTDFSRTATRSLRRQMIQNTVAIQDRSR